MLTFKVSDVEKVTTPMHRASLAQALEDPLLFIRVELGEDFKHFFPDGADDDVETVAYEAHSRHAHLVEAGVGGQSHSFLDAAQRAFQEHRPLVLSPDAVWLLLAQGVGRHILANAEALREQFVQHEGKKTLSVRRDDFIKGAPDNPWPEVFSSFSSQIREHIGKKHALLVPSFSTTTPTTQAACEVVLMSAMQKYFEYDFFTLCGIPEITLEGTLADWQSIRARAAYFAEFGLDQWLKGLLPVLDKIVETVEKPDAIDRDFWRSFFKYHEESGGPFISGWISAFFPEIKSAPGMRVMTSDFPSGISTAPFVWEYLEQRFAMEFAAGFIGVTQDPETSTLSPTIGWAVRDAD